MPFSCLLTISKLVYNQRKPYLPYNRSGWGYNDTAAMRKIDGIFKCLLKSVIFSGERVIAYVKKKLNDNK
jgi:hypothetical protein